MTSPTATPTTVEPKRVLVVEDEPDQQELLRFNLRREGFAVTCAGDGPEALAMINANPPDLIVLDVMLPGMDGLEVCRKVRSNPATRHVPIVMVTAKSEDSDAVAGLELGADDYVTKPYSPRVLLARLKAVLRGRTSGGENTPTASSTIQYRDLTIRPDRFEVIIAGQPVAVSTTEFRMLALLAAKPGRVFTREQMIRMVHGDRCTVTDRSVDVHIFWLRQKLGAAGRYIEAVRGVGYRFRDANQKERD